MALNGSGLEIIAVEIDGEVCRTYSGLSGTFASFVYCCLDKKILPGFNQEGFIKNAALNDRKLMISFSGKRTHKDLIEILDSALLNMVTFPHPGSEAEFFIEAKSNKKGG